MNYPAPTSGASTESAWLNQQLQAGKEKDTLSVEGFDRQETTGGVNFKKKYSTLPPSAPSSPPEMFPFKFYSMSNILDKADDWRTFQMRDGIITGRSKYFLASGSPFTGPYNGNLEIGNQGNFESWFLISGDGAYPDQFLTPPVQTPGPDVSPAGQIVIVNTVDTQIFGYDALFAPIGIYGQMVLSPELDSDNTCFASFWLEFKDLNPSGAYFNLWGRMTSATGTAGRPANPFPPASPNIVPVAIIQAGPNGIIGRTVLNYQIQQFLTGNLTNRYANSLDATCQIGAQRGRWTADSLSGQVFYNGDIVIDDSVTATENVAVTVTPSSGTATATGSFTFNKIYKYIGGGAVESGAPHTDATKWKYIGVYF